MPQVTNYQCPACTAPLTFDGSTGRVACEYCGASYSVAEIEALYASADQAAAEAQAKADEKREQQQVEAEEAGWDTSELGSDWGIDADGMRAYNCPSCGAELICDATTAATECPYCGNPTIVPGQFAGILKPDLVIPFKLKKKDAIEALKKHYEGRPFLPRVFKEQNHVEEIKGVYVPFWLFDGEAEGEANYEGTRSFKYSDGDEEVVETEHYMVYRSGKVAFEKIPVDGSTKMPDDYMDSIEPYDYQELTAFSTAYMPGFLADKYDMTAEECSERADKRAEKTIEKCLRDTVTGYEGVIDGEKLTKLHRGTVKYALLPVWILNTKWNGQNYLFAMNGQTGKMVGDLPVDKTKKWSIFAAVYGVTALATLLCSLSGLLRLFRM